MKSKEVKQIEAKTRQEDCAALSPQTRLANLDKLFGPGKGAAKERAKLAKQIAQASEPKPAKKAKAAA